MTGEDWLNEVPSSDVFTTDSGAQANQLKRAIEFAQLYKVFVDDSRGRELLQHWVDSVEQRDVPPAASLQEYAYWEGRRAFIRGIQRQLKLAKTEGK